MGNCLKSCFGSIRGKSKKNYFTGRYKEYNVGIEFESLIEDDLAQQSELPTVTDRERDHLLNKRYSDLIQDQKRRDAEIDAELRRQEESIRLEEEAYIAAKRESGRAALQARALEQQRSKPVANGTAKSSWLGDNESEWNVAGGEDDFEMFLESVKARSQSVRANVSLLDFQRRGGHTNKLKHTDSSASMEWEYDEGVAPNPYSSSSGDSNLYNRTVIANISSKGNSGGSVSTQEASSEQLESDSDFEPEFVGAETTQEQILIAGARLPSQNPSKPAQTMPAVATKVAQPNKSQVVVQVHDGKPTTPEVAEAANPVTQSSKVQSDEKVSELESFTVITAPEKPHKPDRPVASVAAEAAEVANPVTQSAKVQSDEKVSELESFTVITAPEKPHKPDRPVASVAVDNTDTAQTTTDASTKTATGALAEDDPFDFDKFLEELDLEG